MEEEKKQVVSVYVNIPTTKTALEKVANMVGTFLNDDRIGGLFKKLLAILTRQTASSDNFGVSRYSNH